VKDPISFYLQKFDEQLERNYHTWLFQQHYLFQDKNDLFNIYQLKLRFERRMQVTREQVPVNKAFDVDNEDRHTSKTVA